MSVKHNCNLRASQYNTSYIKNPEMVKKIHKCDRGVHVKIRHISLK